MNTDHRHTIAGLMLLVSVYQQLPVCTEASAAPPGAARGVQQIASARTNPRPLASPHPSELIRLPPTPDAYTRTATPERTGNNGNIISDDRVSLASTRTASSDSLARPFASLFDETMDVPSNIDGAVFQEPILREDYEELPPFQVERPRIIVRPAVRDVDQFGQPILRPEVWLASNPEIEILPTEDVYPSATLTEPNFALQDTAWPVSSGLVEPRPLARRFFQRAWLLSLPMIRSGRDIGIGAERLAFALFEMDRTLPLNHAGMQFDFAHGWEFPDRAEFFWGQIDKKGPKTPARVGVNPSYESVDYQDLRFTMETGVERFSVATMIPLRFTNPTVVRSTGGMGDMTLTTKVLLVDGSSLKLTQLLRTYFNTGSATHGLGTGHMSMELGVLSQYEWSGATFVHNEVKFWFPLGGTPQFSGEVLRYGLGVSHLLYDSDAFAAIPTLEFVAWSVLRGKQSGPFMPGGVDGESSIDGEGILNIYPGIRFVFDNDGDLGLFELGVAGGFSVTDEHWYRGLFRLDLRWSY